MTWNSSEEVTIRVRGTSLEGKCYGPPPSKEAPTIILLHEGLGSVGLWRDFPEKLTELTGLGVFAYSRLGYGNSDPVPLPRPLNYMTDEAVRVLPEILAQVGCSSCFLLGHSDGASIAALYAGRMADDRVIGVGLLAPHFFAEPESIDAIAKVKTAFEKMDLRQRLARHHLDVEGAFYGWNRAWLDPAFINWNIEGALEGIKVPVLVIQGKQDEYGTLKQITALEAGLKSPLVKVIVENCGHSPHQEYPEITLPAILDFFDQILKNYV